ncbi:TPA: hypothetical protein H1558_002902, partial [Listeria monocytogenes]|nr:hypothetical protein [Listeria monocytogenes]
MELSINILNIIGILLEIGVSVYIIISEKKKSKNRNSEAENDLIQQTNNIINNRQGDNASFNYTNVLMQSKYQERAYREILNDLGDKKENKQKSKYGKKCSYLRKVINIVCLGIIGFWAFYYFDLMKITSFNTYLLNVLFQTIFTLATFILIFSLSNFVKLFLIRFKEYNYIVLRKIQLFLTTLFALLGASFWLYFDWRANFRPLFNMYTEGSYYTLGIIMLGLVFYVSHQMAQSFLLNNIWVPKKAVEILL